MASRFEVAVTVSSARDLKNVNWRYGVTRPYAVLWIDPNAKCSTRVAEGDTCPVWDEKLKIPLNTNLHDSVLCIDIVHAKKSDEDKTKPLIGSARISMQEIIDEVGIGEKCIRSVKLKRPSGRPHGKLDVEVAVRDLSYRAPEPYAPPYGYAAPRDYPMPYGAPPPPVGYPYNNPAPYGQNPNYGQPGYGQGGYGAGTYATAQDSKKSSKYGLGTGLAVGAAAGLLGGLAIAEGVDYVEDKISDDVAERVEDDLACDDGYGGDDF